MGWGGGGSISAGSVVKLSKKKNFKKIFLLSFKTE